MYPVRDVKLLKKSSTTLSRPDSTMWKLRCLRVGVIPRSIFSCPRWPTDSSPVQAVWERYTWVMSRCRPGPGFRKSAGLGWIIWAWPSGYKTYEVTEMRKRGRKSHELLRKLLVTSAVNPITRGKERWQEPLQKTAPWTEGHTADIFRAPAPAQSSVW